jgi:hypothetical protein
MNGIYILANDFVYHQLIALLNSIEANVGVDVPICIMPYDDRLDQVRAEIARRPQVSLFENQAAIAKWEAFATRAWLAHDRAQAAWKLRDLPAVYRLAMHRKLCCFEGEFDRFIYFDADTLALGPVDAIFEQLADFDWVANDYQYCSDRKYIFDVPEAQLSTVFTADQIASRIFCAGWFASKKGVFSDAKLAELLTTLEAGEADVMALWGPDQSLMNYLVLRSKISYYNFAFQDKAPGSHWSSQFEEIDQVLYDQGRQLTYLHYMSIPTTKFNQLCDGIDVAIPYRDLFLHYRYLQAPAQRPREFVQLKESRSLPQFFSQKLGNLQHRLRQLTAKLADY